jgi:acetyltransferase-like isoleucine patch superfamily enzyme
MNEFVAVLVDQSNWSRNALSSVVLPTGCQPREINLRIDELDKQAEVIANLQGPVINLLSPETFSLYRSKLYQILGLNNKAYPYENRRIQMQGARIARWSYVAEGVRFSSNVGVGLATYIGPNTVIGPNSKIGNFCWIDEGVTIGAGVEIKSHVTIHSRVIVGSGALITKFNEIRNDVSQNRLLTEHSIELNFYGGTAYIHGI